MLEEVTASASIKQRPVIGIMTALVKRCARLLLRWQPEGSLMVELPTGERIRFGRAGADGEPILKVHSYNLLAKALRRGTIGFAEAYINGDIECSDLLALFRFFVRNRDRFIKTSRGLFKVRLGDRIAHRYRRNSRLGSRRNISEHYDLSNDFFRLWLDPELHYSSGLYSAGAQSLEEAQRAKLELIFDMLDLSSGEHLLEIGCGWGALARHAARARHVQVTGVTLSREQLAYARKQADAEGLGASCSFLLQDYRDIRGSFDHIVSVEMIEAVGEDYWPTYFQALNDRLKTGGAAVIQAITIDETRFDAYRRKADFIQRYIFPGGLLPTPTAIAHQAALAGLRIERVERFGLSYARTLREWRKRFEATWPQAAKLGLDERFRRQWRYYLAYCEAGFLEGVIDVGIYQLRKA